MTDQMARLMELRRRLELCWDRRTAHPDWKWIPTAPSNGQCYITALIVQDLFGGEIMHAIVKPMGQIEKGKRSGDVVFVAHVWNRLPDGAEVDLTSDQFDGTVPNKVDWLFGKPRAIGAKRSNPRYKLLKRRLEALRSV